MKYASLIAIALAVLAQVGLADEPVVDPMLVDQWRDVASGTTLTITSDGQFSIVSSSGDVVESGTVACVAFEQVDWFPGSYSAALVLRFNHDNKDYPVSGYWYPGEGDPSGLDLCASRVRPGWLFEPFGLTREAGRLLLQGSGP